MTGFRITLASIVTGVWLLDFLNAAYFIKGYAQHGDLTWLMGIVLGWALGGEARDFIRRGGVRGVIRRWLDGSNGGGSDAPKK